MARMLARLVLFVGFLSPASASAADQAAAGVPVDVAVVGDSVRSQLADRGSPDRVRVLVMLKDAPGADPRADRRDAIRTDVDALLASLPAGSHQVRRRFVLVPGLALEIDARALAALESNPRVRRVDLDEGGAGHLLEAKPLSKVDQVFNLGETGAGIKVAVVDSGIDTDHPDFSGRIVAQQCFCSGVAGTVGCCPNALDTMSGAGSAEDDHGHGTNVSGILLGGGTVASAGAAPGANLISVKVLDSNNTFCCTSDVVAGLDWVRVNHPDTKVVNASLGTGLLYSGACDTTDSFSIAFATAVNNLVSNGTLVFASSGNQRSSTKTSAPACVAATISVGAVWDAARADVTFPVNGFNCTDTGIVADKATCFTNSNAQVDLYAPGAPITASGRNGITSTFFGTSQASPLAAGCAATLRADSPAAPRARIEAALKASPTRIIDPKSGLEFPRLDCLSAYDIVHAVVFDDGYE